MLYQKGYSKEDVLDLFRFIDWVIYLPKDLEDKYLEEVREYEGVRKMEFVAPFERMAKSEGKREGKREGEREGKKQQAVFMLLRLLKAKFGYVPESIEHLIRSARNLETIERISEKIFEIQGIDDVLAFFNKDVIPKGL